MKPQVWRTLLCCFAAAIFLTLGVLAADIVGSGTCGNNLTWTLDNKGTLTISGIGEMNNYDNTYSNQAPWYAKTITDVVINSGVTTIGNYAFDACYGLKSVTIPTGVLSIGESAFSVCSRLPNITLPDSVITVGKDAFHGCGSLTSVTIPDSVANINEGAFSRCERLITINVNLNNPMYSSIDGVLFNKSQSVLLTYPCGKEDTVYNIPNSVTTIGYGAFYECTKLTSVTIPASVDVIAENAFNGCYDLTNLTIPDGVMTIGEMAFANCQSLVNMTIPSSVTIIGDGAFFQCSVTNIILSSNITAIGNEVFKNCDELLSITIPDSVTFIGDLAFCNCANLESVVIPNSVTKIGKGAFFDCNKLADVHYSGTLSQWNEIIIDEENYPLSFVALHCADKELMPSENIIVAQGYCGAENDGTNLQWRLTSARTLTISGSGAMKDYQTFWEDWSGENRQPWYDYDSHIKTVIVEHGVTRIGDVGFWSLSKLTSVTLPESVTTIGRLAFYSCSNLRSITIPCSVTTIGNQAFWQWISDSLVLYVYENSYAHTYALENELAYEFELHAKKMKTSEVNLIKRYIKEGMRRDKGQTTLD